MIKLALDKSLRSVDEDGRLHVAKSHISKATVNPYYGREIPDYQGLGLEPDKVYRLYRDPVELEKAAPTFARLPILSEHVPVTVDAPQPDLIIGAIGSDIAFDNPYLDADLCFWDATAIASIETETAKELSCAYRYVPVMISGEFEGTAYDGIMTEIRGNHLALVELGRAGSDVVVADHKTVKEAGKMKMTKLGKALFVAIGAAAPKIATDSALGAIVGSVSKKKFDKDGIKGKIMALDVELNPQQLDNIIDALLDVEQGPEDKPVVPDSAEEDFKPKVEKKIGEDESPAEKLKALLAGKVDESIIEEACKLFEMPAEDEKDEDLKDIADKSSKPVDVKAAMDGLRKEMKAAEQARRDVASVVGDVFALDKASDIYAFALDHMAVDYKGVTGDAALAALFRVASSKSAAPARIALDGEAMAKQFPGAMRFRNA
jgi:hypothetical protein